MTGTQSIAAAAIRSQPAPATPAPGSEAADTEDRFLKLLVAQMRNQDPLDPLDNAQVTSQLAQISTVRGIEEMKRSLGSLAAAAGSASSAGSLGLLGREVLVPGERFAVSDPSRAPALGYELSGAARTVRVEVIGGDGSVVHAVESADVDGGVHRVGWGDEAPAAGAYRLSVRAFSIDGAELPVTALVSARVDGVSQGPDGAWVALSSGSALPAAAVRAIY